MSKIEQSVLLKEAKSLRSGGENPEYDRALLELLYWTDPKGNTRETWADWLGLDLIKLYGPRV